MRTLAPLLALLTLSACAGAKRAAIEEAMHDIWEVGNLDRIDANYEPELGWEIRRFVQENRDLYPDLKITIDDAVIKGNRYVTLWTVTGTHRDVGRTVKLSGVSVRTRVDGKIVEEKMYFDQKAIYDQLGFSVVPPPELSPFEVMEERGQTGGSPLPPVPDAFGMPMSNPCAPAENACAPAENPCAHAENPCAPAENACAPE